MRLEKAFKIIKYSSASKLSPNRKMTLLKFLYGIKLSSEESNILDNYALNTNDDFIIAYTANFPWANLQKHAEKILSNRNPEACCYFAFNFGLICDIEKFREVVLLSNDPKTNLAFLEYDSTNPENIKKHSNAIARSKNTGYNYLFCVLYGDKIDCTLNEEVVLENGTPIENLKFVQDVTKANIKKHREVVLKSDSLEANIKFPLLIDSTLEEAKAHYDKAINILIAQLNLGTEDLSYMDLLGLLKDRINNGYYNKIKRINNYNKGPLLALKKHNHPSA